MLAQGHVQRTDAAPYGRSQRTFDPDLIGAEGFHGLLGQPAAGLLEGFLPGQDFFPQNVAPAAIGFFQRGADHSLGGGGDLGTYSVAFDKGDFYLVGHLKPARGVDT